MYISRFALLFGFMCLLTDVDSGRAFDIAHTWRTGQCAMFKYFLLRNKRFVMVMVIKYTIT